jgi:hypothetical protein
MSISDDVVAEVVTEVLGKILCRPRTTFSLSDELVRDLRIASDDLSFMFVPLVERKLRVKVPVKEWRMVCTGIDACNLLRKHLANRGLTRP